MLPGASTELSRTKNTNYFAKEQTTQPMLPNSQIILMSQFFYQGVGGIESVWNTETEFPI